MPSSEHGNPSYLQDGRKPGKQEPKREIKQVTTGNVTQRQSLAQRVLASDPSDIRSQVLTSVIVPAIKEMVRKGFMTVLDLALYGSVRNDTGTRKAGNMRTPYNSMYDRTDRRAIRPSARAAFNFDDVIFEDREDAQAVLDVLVDDTYEYGMASVAEFYELSGLPTNHTDNKWGWEELNGANVMLVRDGYILNLPKPILLEG